MYHLTGYSFEGLEAILKRVGVYNFTSWRLEQGVFWGVVNGLQVCYHSRGPSYTLPNRVEDISITKQYHCLCLIMDSNFLGIFDVCVREPQFL